jgi:hypothetical protein
MSEGYEKKDVSVTAIVLVSFFTILLVVVFIVLLKDYFVFNKEKYVYNNVLNMKSGEFEALKKANNLMIDDYRVIDKEFGTYQIPIEKAMELVVEEYADK